MLKKIKKYDPAASHKIYILLYICTVLEKWILIFASIFTIKKIYQQCSVTIFSIFLRCLSYSTHLKFKLFLLVNRKLAIVPFSNISVFSLNKLFCLQDEIILLEIIYILYRCKRFVKSWRTFSGVERIDVIEVIL